MYRRRPHGVEVFLVHPGGPYFARRDAGSWSIPKGLVEAGEELLAVAVREFHEETGRTVDECRRGDDLLVPLGHVRQKSGKIVHAWAFEGEWPPDAVLRSNTFEIEWPPGSGARREYPEVDRAEFFPIETAREKINPAQVAFVDRLLGGAG
jgi:predicted NUDIX family NTP pyrophosphohydrolase